MLVSLRQNEAELEKMTDGSSEMSRISGEPKLSATVQRVTSRFQSLQSTCKVLHSIFPLQEWNEYIFESGNY